MVRIRAVRLAVASALLASMMAAPARAWGRLGHRVSGRIAEARLTPTALEAVRSLLEPGESLADVSTWADEVRRDRPESAPWHYVNVMITEEKFENRHVPPEGCVVTKIDEFRKLISDPKLPRKERAEALKYLAHFVEDMHQPVHVGHRADRGGNDLQVQFFGEGSNLHRVWDSGLLDQAKRDEAGWVERLEKSITPEQVEAWSKGTPADWATESLLAARGAYRDPATGDELKKGAKLGQPYEGANLPVAERRLAQAGVRLAWVLNSAFPEPTPSK